MYSVCILIYVSMKLPIYTRYIWTGCRRCFRAIWGAPENDDRQNWEIHSEAVIKWVGGRNREDWEIHLEAVIVRVWGCTWRPWSCECGDALGGRDHANLEAVVEPVWMSTLRWLMDGSLGAETLFISLLTPNRENVTRWLYLWALIESWLMAVNRGGRHAISWSYIRRSTHNRENERETNNHRWMLYSVDALLGGFFVLVHAVLGVNSWSCHGEIDSNDLTLSSAMMVELLTRKGEMRDEDENNVDETSGYEKSGVRLAWLGCEDLISQ